VVLPLKHERKWLPVNIKGSLTDTLLGQHLRTENAFYFDTLKFKHAECLNVIHWRRVLFSFIDSPLFPSQVNRSSLTQNEDILHDQIKKILDVMEHYFSLGEIDLAIQEIDSLIALLKAADYRINETFLLQVSLEQIVLNLVLIGLPFKKLINGNGKNRPDHPLTS